MKIRRSYVLIAAVVIVVGLGTYLGVSLSASTTAAVPKAMLCSGASQERPTSYVLSCTDDNSGLVNIKWSTWSQSKGTASATYSMNDCTPTCVAGKFENYPATVRFSDPQSTEVGPLFSSARISYRRPSGKTETFTTSLPTSPL